MRDDDPLKYFPGYAEACAKAEANNLTIPEGYPKHPHRQIPNGAIRLEGKISMSGRWIDLLAHMPHGDPVYVTTKAT